VRRHIIIMAGVLAASALAFHLVRKPSASEPSEESRHFVWSVDMWALKAISVHLPQQDKSETWVKHADQFWYFDAPNGSPVDLKRWGGGIPFILSSPKSDRFVAHNSTPHQLEIYGLSQPSMRIDLLLENKNVIKAEVGDLTPDGEAYYIRLADSMDVSTIDHTWYEVIARLVLDPPYPDQGPAEPPMKRVE
jgi:hypothetical protein